MISKKFTNFFIILLTRLWSRNHLPYIFSYAVILLIHWIYLELLTLKNHEDVVYDKGRLYNIVLISLPLMAPTFFVNFLYLSTLSCNPTIFLLSDYLHVPWRFFLLLWSNKNINLFLLFLAPHKFPNNIKEQTFLFFCVAWVIDAPILIPIFLNPNKEMQKLFFWSHAYIFSQESCKNH